MINPGDPIYYYNKNGDTMPARVVTIYPISRRLKIQSGFEKPIIVKQSNCDLQSEKP
jgi:hypothetical protein